jgi:cyclopropane fatty-acyl-phospholipid synthase-like methyltransferase
MSSPARESNTVTEQIGEFYDDVGELVEIVGGNLHVGYWEDERDATPFLEAMHRLTGMMEDRLRLRPGQRVLDVGCGVAEPAVQFARRTEVSITGITVSDGEIGEANRRIAAAGLRGRVSVEWADACAMPFPDGSFDAAIAFDSLPSTADKSRWLAEIFRVLRPGGRFVFSEYPVVTELTAEEAEILRMGAILAPPAGLREVAGIAESTGFAVEEALDLSDRVRRWYPEFFRKLAGQRAGLAERYGEERISLFEQGITPVFGVCREKIGYLILACRKP